MHRKLSNSWIYPRPETETAMIELKMMLQEAIEEVKRLHKDNDFADHEFYHCDADEPMVSIATILNAVVKGELKHE